MAGVADVEALAQRDIEAQRTELAQTVRDLIDAHGLQGAQWRLDALARSGGAVDGWVPARDARRLPLPHAHSRGGGGRAASNNNSGRGLVFLAGCAGAAAALAAGGVLLYVRLRDAGHVDRAGRWLARLRAAPGRYFLGGVGDEDASEGSGDQLEGSSERSTGGGGRGRARGARGADGRGP